MRRDLSTWPVGERKRVCHSPPRHGELLQNFRLIILHPEQRDRDCSSLANATTPFSRAALVHRCVGEWIAYEMRGCDSAVEFCRAGAGAKRNRGCPEPDG